MSRTPLAAPISKRRLGSGDCHHRNGIFPSAADWAHKPLSHLGDIPERDIEACMVLAMAHYHSKQTAEARATLAKGVEIAETRLPRLDTADTGDRWLDWIIAHALLKEARVLISAELSPTVEKQQSP